MNSAEGVQDEGEVTVDIDTLLHPMNAFAENLGAGTPVLPVPSGAHIDEVREEGSFFFLCLFLCLV